MNRSFRLRRPDRPISPPVGNGPAAAPDSVVRTRRLLAFSAMTMIAGMLVATLATPAAQPASAAGADIAFQAHTGTLWKTVTSDDVGHNTGLSIAPHTNASVAQSAHGRVRANKRALWTLSPQGIGRAEVTSLVLV